eukprot:TRINITY_DN25921_c0_g1_i1.p1 TRINITY_DN25921_c0_g1~~TRINITY_DN25921_c0_g1_i1.p1  ORF type:complete len:509 (-),score=98.85 TRINITY_DN25921_c0_g1_i1:79-1569(-)
MAQPRGRPFNSPSGYGGTFGGGGNYGGGYGCFGGGVGGGGGFGGGGFGGGVGRGGGGYGSGGYGGGGGFGGGCGAAPSRIAPSRADPARRYGVDQPPMMDSRNAPPPSRRGPLPPSRDHAPPPASRWSGSSSAPPPRRHDRASVAGKLFLGGISPSTSTQTIEDHFRKYGPVTDAVAMYKDGQHRGFGFVTFETTEAAKAALAEKQVIDGRTVDVKQAVPGADGSSGGPPPSRNTRPPPTRARGGSRPPPARGGSQGPVPPRVGSRSGFPRGGTKGRDEHLKVFIGGLPQGCTERMLQDAFGRYGQIDDAVVMLDKASGRQRGFGFVTFSEPDAVDAVMEKFDKHQVNGKWVEIKRALPRDAAPPQSSIGDARRGRSDREASDDRSRSRSPRTSPTDGECGKEGLPKDWEAVADEEGNEYYHNISTGETQWDFPGEAPAEDNTDEYADAVYGDASEENGAAGPLKGGWEELTTESGEVYYHCTKTGETAWTRPDDS